MSKIIWNRPTIYDPINYTTKYLSINLKNNYYIWLLYCFRMGIEIPKDIKRLVLNYICPNWMIGPQTFGQWWLEYITDSFQQHKNPVIIYDDAYDLISNLPPFPKVDILYEFNECKLENNKCDLNRYADFIFGIVPNPQIKTIKLTFADQHFKFKIEQIKKIEITNVQIYGNKSLKDYYNDKFLGDKKEELMSVKTNSFYLWVLDIFPFLIRAFCFHSVTIEIESEIPIDNIIFLVGFVNPNMFKELIETQIKYKKWEFHPSKWRFYSLNEI